MMDILQTEVNLMILEIDRIKKLRCGQNEYVTFFEKNKIRNYLFSVVIKGDKKDKLERTNDVLKLLDMSELSKEGK